MQPLKQMETVDLKHAVASWLPVHQAHEHSTQKGAAHVAHEHLGGAAVPEQEAAQRTRQAVYAVGEVAIGGFRLT